MGRPTRDFDRKVFEGLCQIQCTFGEIESIFWTDKRVIEKWVEREYGETFDEVYKRFADEGKMSLRRMQFAHAKKNATMCIFLGKVILGQRDNLQNDTAPNDNALTHLLSDMRKYFQEKSKEVEGEISPKIQMIKA